MKRTRKNQEEVVGEVKEGLRVKKRGATKAFYNSDGDKVSNEYHSIWEMDDGRYIGKAGASRHVLDVDEDHVDEITEGAHEIEKRGSGYILRLGASRQHVDYNGNPSRIATRAPVSTSNKPSIIERLQSKKDNLIEKLEPSEPNEEDLDGVNRVLSGVEEHTSRKQDSQLYSLRVRASNLTGKGNQISLQGDSSSTVNTQKFEEFFSPLVREHPSDVDYEGSMPEESHKHLLEDIIEKNETRIESCIGEGKEREPEIIAYDTGDGIMYEGLVHLLIDTEAPFGEEPHDFVADPHEEEFEVRVEVPYEEATEMPQSDVDSQEAEDQIFETEVSYN